MTERLLISSGLGAGITSLAILGLGLAGGLHPIFLRYGWLIGAAACLAVWGYRKWRNHQENDKDTGDIVLPIKTRLDYLAHAALIVICSATTMNLLATAAPEIFFDSLVYHLALPKLYLLHGRIVPTPWNLYSGLPFGMEMLYGLALALSNEHLAVLLHCSFGWAAALALGNWLRRYSSGAGGILGALIFSLCPVVLAAEWQSGVDLGTAFYISLALIAVSHALQTTDERQSLCWSVVCGLLIGFSLGTKYTVLPLGAAFVIVHGWLRKRSGQSFRDTVWMAVAASMTFLPWLLKNFFFYSNPVYPFFHDHFGSIAPAHWNAFLGDAHARDFAGALGSIEGWKDIFLLPWKITIDQYFDYRLSLAYLLIFPWIFLVHWGLFKKDETVPNAWTAVAVITLAGYFSWSMSSTIVRFLIPVLLLSAGGLVLAFGKKLLPPWLRQIIWFLTIWVCTGNFAAIFIDGMTSPELSGKWDVVSGRQSQADYLKERHIGYGQPYYAAMEYINQNLPRNAKVMFLGESRAYYCERDFIAATSFDYSPFWVAARDSKNAAELQAKLKSLGITHLFLNVPQLYANANFSAMLPQDVASGPVFSKFWTGYLRKKFEKKEYSAEGQIKEWLEVYELRDAPETNLSAYSDNPILDTLRILHREGS